VPMRPTCLFKMEAACMGAEVPDADWKLLY
jgi:hypothetical protein